MKVKKVIFLLGFFLPSIFHAAIIRHTVTSVTEQKILGHTFKHVITSGSSGKDEFFIDGVSVLQDEYEGRLEAAVKAEHEERLARQKAAIRTRLEFVDAMQLEIVAKLLGNVVVDAADIMEKIENPALAKFFVFHQATVESHDQLVYLKNLISQLDHAIEHKIANRDIDGLNFLYTNLEVWPARLEKFFQDTVQHAIKKSDDTAMLKDLLKLVSELS